MPLLAPEQLEKVDGWLRSVLWEGQLPGVETSQRLEVHRLKSRLSFQTGEVKMVQGVREIFEIFDAPKTSTDEEPSEAGKIVLIGRQLQALDIERSFRDSIKL